MTLKEDDKKALIEYKITRAEETLEEAKLLFANNKLFGTVDRLYYACFYSVEALLFTKDLSFSKHEHVKGAFNREFANKGLIDVKYKEFFKEMLDKRKTGDYGNFIVFTHDKVESYLNNTEEFIGEINKLTMKLIQENKK